jgi:hypothetical protein
MEADVAAEPSRLLHQPSQTHRRPNVLYTRKRSGSHGPVTASAFAARPDDVMIERRAPQPALKDAGRDCLEFTVLQTASFVIPTME